MAVVNARRGTGHPPRQALKDAIKATLCSPAFLYLAEPVPKLGETRLNPHDLASRLSYFLWATMPDDQLRALADGGRPHQTRSSPTTDHPPLSRPALR